MSCSTDFRKCYRLSSHTLELGADTSTLMHGVHAALERLGLVAVDTDSERPSAVLRLSARSRNVRLPSEAKEIATQDGIRAWRAGCRIYLTCEGHTFRLDPRTGMGDGVIPSSTSALRKDVLIYAVLLLLRRRGLYGLHASGVSKEDVGYLLVGQCGSGKSTYAYGLVRRGWRYLGDDSLLLVSNHDQVEAVALRRDLYLDSSLLSHFPEACLDGTGTPLSSKGKRRVAMDVIFPVRRIDRCVPGVLLFPEIGAAPTSRLVLLKPAEALKRLVEQSVVFALDVEAVPNHFEVLNQLVWQSQSFQLLAGQDLKYDPELIADLVADVPGLARAPTPHTKT